MWCFKCLRYRINICSQRKYSKLYINVSITNILKREEFPPPLPLPSLMAFYPSMCEPHKNHLRQGYPMNPNDIWASVAAVLILFPHSSVKVHKGVLSSRRLAIKHSLSFVANVPPQAAQSGQCWLRHRVVAIPPYETCEIGPFRGLALIYPGQFDSQDFALVIKKSILLSRR